MINVLMLILFSMSALTIPIVIYAEILAHRHKRLKEEESELMRFMRVQNEEKMGRTN